MTDRERLIELLVKSTQKCDSTDCNRCKYWNTNDCGAARMADHILSDGWIRPPCKVGDTVYVIDLFDYEPCKKSGECGDVCPYLHAEYGVGYECSKTKCGEKPYECVVIKPQKINDIQQVFDFYDRIGRVVFLTPEEAEKALAERQGKNEKTLISKCVSVSSEGNRTKTDSLKESTGGLKR